MERCQGDVYPKSRKNKPQYWKLLQTNKSIIAFTKNAGKTFDMSKSEQSEVELDEVRTLIFIRRYKVDE